MERMTGIEPAYSAWEYDQHVNVRWLTCWLRVAAVTVIDPAWHTFIAHSSHAERWSARPALNWALGLV
jgi:hypothetical protein